MKDYALILKEIKAANPDIPHKDAQAQAKIEWAKEKEKQNSDQPEETDVVETVVEKPTKASNTKAIVFDTEEEFNAAVLRALEKIKLSSPEPPAQQEYNDPDVMEEPALFFSYVFSRSIFSYKKNGRVTSPPGGKIKFEHSHRYDVVGKNQKEHKMMNLCTFKTYSRSTAEWLRSYPMYGVTIFEDIRNVKVEDVEFATVMGEIALSVNNMSTTRLIERAKMTPGVSMTSDFDELRKRLLTALTRIELDERKRRNYLIAKDTREKAEQFNVVHN